ncbi:MAG: hypothetical protein D6748_03570 [Calditrichaeota bacterium]|nr:MAG: hypothetical protein D6748_03570 [Calditrichota bacterium]
MDWLWKGGIKPNFKVVGGIALGFTGIFLLITQGSLHDFSHINPLAAAALIFASLSWATGSIYSRHAHLPSSPFMAIAMQMLSGGVLLSLAGLLAGEHQKINLSQITPLSWLSWAYLIIFGALIGFTCYIWLLRVAPAAKVATYAYVNPIIAVFLGWLFAEERVTLQTLIASGIIITAVFLINSSKTRKKVETEPSSSPNLPELEEIS